MKQVASRASGFLLGYSPTLSIKATCSSKTSVGFQRNSRRYIREYVTLHNHKCETAKYYVASWRSVLLEKSAAVAQTFKIFPAFYGAGRLITVFTVARHWSLFWVRWIQSTPRSYFCKIHFNTIPVCVWGFLVVSSLNVFVWKLHMHYTPL
jgi:hypothetical protein